MRSALLVLILVGLFPAIISAQASPQDMLAQGDALRSQGDFAGALSVYREAIAAGGESSEAWKRVAWSEKALRHFSAARQAFENALTHHPNDKEAQDDLASLKLFRGLALRAWMGGTEPGTSRTAADGEAWYGGVDQLDLSAGGGWTDNIFYSSWKGYASAYWYFLPESYAKLKLGMWVYTYVLGSGSVPDSSAYQYDPRVQAEVSSWFVPFLRGSLAYQLDVPNFWYDTSTWITSHKLTTELETRFGGLHFWGTAGMLYDPDPNLTVVANAPGNGLLPTSVAYRFEPLLGIGASYEGSIWSLGARLLTNRDLDSSYLWSTISRFTLQPLDRLSFDLEWILDFYSTNAGAPYAGNYGSILWGEVGFEVLRGVILSAGIKWVDNPGPWSVTIPGSRNDVSLLLALQYKTGLY